MADNYLESRYEAVFGKGPKAPSHKQRPSLDTLLAKNRSVRGYNKDYVVHELQLRTMVSVNSRIPSAMNQQALRFHLVTKGPEADIVNANIKLGAALPQLNLPFPGTEPEAFIIVASEKEESSFLDIDLGISLQSMLLKAVEMGLNGIIVKNFNPSKLAEELGMPEGMKPLCVLAVGKSIEKIETVEAKPGESLKYYRENGTHYVPKIKPEDLIF